MNACFDPASVNYDSIFANGIVNFDILTVESKAKVAKLRGNLL